MKLSDLSDIELVWATIILEAWGEPFLGKLAVASVIRERLTDKRWPDTWHGVCLQDKQFSCWNDIDREKDISAALMDKAITARWEEIWWKECQLAAFGAVSHYFRHVVPAANHYHAEDRKPYWTEAPEAKCLAHIGRHIFWRL